MNHKEFIEERKNNIGKLAKLEEKSNIGLDFMIKTTDYKYTYNFDWLGLPVIQTPQDIVAIQEIIWATKPNIIIETGIARGGSLIFYASMLTLLNNNGRVIGVDIDIRSENKKAILDHPLSNNITLLEGSSTDSLLLDKIKSNIGSDDKVLIILDSDHSHSHVLEELKVYSPMVSSNSYLIVLDTIIEDLPPDSISNQNRHWGKGNNPKTAVHEFLKNNNKFEIDFEIQNKLMFTVARDGYLRCKY